LRLKEWGLWVVLRVQAKLLPSRGGGTLGGVSGISKNSLKIVPDILASDDSMGRRVV